MKQEKRKGSSERCAVVKIVAKEGFVQKFTYEQKDSRRIKRFLCRKVSG